MGVYMRREGDDVVIIATAQVSARAADVLRENLDQVEGLIRDVFLEELEAQLEREVRLLLEGNPTQPPRGLMGAT